MKMFEKLSDVRAIIFQPLVTKLSLSLAISQIKVTWWWLWLIKYVHIIHYCPTNVYHLYRIPSLYIIPFVSGWVSLLSHFFNLLLTKAVGGRQYERTTDTFGFCKILFSHFFLLMIIIMFSSNTFKMLRSSDEEFENILAPNGIFHWCPNCAQRWPDKFIRDFWEIFGNIFGIFGILYWCSNCAAEFARPIESGARDTSWL